MTNIEKWFSKNFGINARVRHEIHTNCPKCSHEQFYFNTNRMVGYCHHDKCHYSPTLKDLITLVGNSPGAVFSSPDVAPPREVTVALPEDAVRLVDRDGGDLVTVDSVAVNEVQKRGITPMQMFRYNFHINDTRVYIPIYETGKLVQYIGRAKWWQDTGSPLRYKYATGVGVGDFLFNWDVAKFYDRLILVENTFNAIWLEDLSASSNFGSHLTKAQMDKISHSKIKHVILMWDEGTEKSGQKAATALRSRGIDVTQVVFPGQPDNYSFAEIESWVDSSIQMKNRKLFPTK